MINAALGISIRGAGLARPIGGMRGFLRSLTARYVEIGGTIKLRTPVSNIDGELGAFSLRTNRQIYSASQVVCALPIQATRQLAPNCVGPDLDRYIERDETALGGGLVLCLGVPESEVQPDHRGHRHHQLLQSYEQPLGNGNNMFISVSAPDDFLSAPQGSRSVMISTHCALQEWDRLNPADYLRAKQLATDKLLGFARRVYPNLGACARVIELGTPRTYEKFAGRPLGAIGGARLSMKNSNQNAVPYDLCKPGLWLAGDTTWPGLGTVASILGARHVSEGALVLSRKISARHNRQLSERAPRPQNDAPNMTAPRSCKPFRL